MGAFRFHMGKILWVSVSDIILKKNRKKNQCTSSSGYKAELKTSSAIALAWRL
jgi:hypothetical protein